MQIEDSNRFGALSRQVLSAFETNFKLKLPLAYREFLLLHNGGYPNPDAIDLPTECGATSLRQIYGIHDGEYWASLVWAKECYEGRIPADLLPFGDDPMGNAFVIGIAGDRLNKIYFWDHELEADEYPNYDNLTLVANSFNELLEMCYEWVDPNETVQESIIRTNDVASLKALILGGFDVNTKNEYDRTMIENAAIAGKVELVQELLSNNAEVNQALEYAIQNNEDNPKAQYEQIIALLEKVV